MLAKNSLIAPRTPFVNGLSSMLAAGCGGVGAQRLQPDLVEERIGLLREYVAQRGEAREAALEAAPFPSRTRSIMCIDDVLVLAAQRRQLGELLADAGGARIENGAHGAGQRAHVGLRCSADDVALGRDELLRQRRLRAPGRRLRASSASSPLTFASSAFCADAANTCATRNAEHLRARRAPGDRSPRRSPRSDLSSSQRPSILLRITMRPALRGRVVAGQVLVPHLEVGLGDARVGGQDEEERVRVGQQVERELGLGADRIEPRRVEDHEPLLQQRMREVDDRVPPAGDVDAALVAVRRARPGCRPRRRP